MGYFLILKFFRVLFLNNTTIRPIIGHFHKLRDVKKIAIFLHVRKSETPWTTFCHETAMLSYGLIAVFPYDLIAVFPYGLIAVLPYGLIAVFPYGLINCLVTAMAAAIHFSDEPTEVPSRLGGGEAV